MSELNYHLLDVFTDTPFAGNGLAVFVDPPALTTEQMQSLAREINLSETVFVSSTTFETRIFTPSIEMPFAGHPTVGTAVLLAHLGVVSERVMFAKASATSPANSMATAPPSPRRACPKPSPYPNRVCWPRRLAWRKRICIRSSRPWG